MSDISSEFDKYQRRVRFVEHLVEQAVESSKSAVVVAPREIDKTKAFVVLAYAETEDFIESCSLFLIDKLDELTLKLESELKEDGVAQSKAVVNALKIPFEKILRDKEHHKIARDIFSLKKNVNLAKAESALAYIKQELKNKRHNVSANNSLNQKDLKKLFDDLGFNTEDDFIDLRNELQNLTVLRGQFAHSGEGYLYRGAVRNEPDPRSERDRVRRVSVGIEGLVGKIHQYDLSRF